MRGEKTGQIEASLRCSTCPAAEREGGKSFIHHNLLEEQRRRDLFNYKCFLTI